MPAVVYPDQLTVALEVRKSGVLAILALLSSLLMASMFGTAEAKTVKLGSLPYNVKPSCEPKPRDCTVVGKTTGFQAKAGNRRSPYVVGVKKGNVVSWGMVMGDPTKWTDFFNDIFGERSRVRLAVLRKSKSPGRYRLMRQTETVELNSYFGSSPAFALADPMPVRKGDVLAITVLTWAPAFRVNLPSTYSWRADRKRGGCGNVRKGVTHTRLKSTRPYQCLYRTAQLLYYVEIETG